MAFPVGRYIITYTTYCVSDSPKHRLYKKILNYISASWHCSRQAFCLTYCYIGRKVHWWNAKWLGNPHCTSVIQSSTGRHLYPILLYNSDIIETKLFRVYFIIDEISFRRMAYVLFGMLQTIQNYVFLSTMIASDRLAGTGLYSVAQYYSGVGGC